MGEKGVDVFINFGNVWKFFFFVGIGKFIFLKMMIEGYLILVCFWSNFFSFKDVIVKGVVGFEVRSCLGL